METFAEVIARLSGATENPLPVEIATELSGAYAHEIGIREAAIADREARILDAENRVKAKDVEAITLKAANYDLLKLAQVPATDADDNKPDNDDAPKGIDSLFGKG